MRKTTRHHFTNSRGFTLSALLDMPDADPIAYGVFAPCFTCTKESHGAHKINRALAERGIAMLRFDITGIGESKGDFTATNFSTRIDDIRAAYQYVADTFSIPTLLMGHSIGGTAALAASAHLPHLPILATVGSPQSSKALMDKFYQLNLVREIDDKMAEVIVVGRPYILEKTFISDMYAHDVHSSITTFKNKLRIFHAPHDEISGFGNAEAIYAAATCDKKLIPLTETATHLLEKGDVDAALIADEIIAAI